MKKLKKSKHQGKASNHFINKIKILTIICLTAFVAIIACSKDDILNADGNCGDSSWVQKVEKELTAWNNAATAFGSDPTNANCNKYKSTGKNYLDALEGIKSCVVGINSNEFKKAIQDAKNELDALSCE